MTRNYTMHLEECPSFFKDINANKPFIQIGADYLEEYGFEIKPIEGHTFQKDFPNCCEFHKDLRKNIDDWFSEFPNCCADHKKIALRKWFKKDKYLHVPDKIMNQISYTKFFISKMIEDENWYKEITDYIEYNLDSFGTPSVGSGKYWQSLENFINTYTPQDWEFPKWKRDKLVEYFLLQEKLSQNSNKDDSQKKDMNILFSTFQKWQKTFPNLSYFQNIKKDLKDKFPINIILYEPSYNKYTGQTKFKVKTQTELIEILIDITKNLLSQVDTNKLISENKIKEKEKLEIDLISANHQIKQDKLLKEYSRSEIKYVKIIKKWLRNEVDYFKELQKKIPPMIINTKNATIISNDGNGTQIVNSGDNNSVIIGDSNIVEYHTNDLKKIKDILNEIKVQSEGIDSPKLEYIMQEIARINLSLESKPQKPNIIKNGLNVIYDLLMEVAGAGISPTILATLSHFIK